jgi:NADH-quinone oxidoreductase subunit A
MIVGTIARLCAGFFLVLLCESVHEVGSDGGWMGSDFTPVFLFVLVAILVAAGMLVTSALLGPRKLTPVKQMPYESGMDPVGDARQRFDVRYYLVAMVFLLFDVELLYFYPWAVGQWSAGPAQAESASETLGGSLAPFASLGPAGIPANFRGLVLLEVLVFVAILAAALAYAWKKGVFTWR